MKLSPIEILRAEPDHFVARFGGSRYVVQVMRGAPYYFFLVVGRLARQKQYNLLCIETELYRTCIYEKMGNTESAILRTVLYLFQEGNATPENLMALATTFGTNMTNYMPAVPPTPMSLLQ